MTQEIGSVMERKFLVEVVRALSQKVVKSAQMSLDPCFTVVKTTFWLKVCILVKVHSK